VGPTDGDDLMPERNNKSPLWYIFIKAAKKRKEYAITP
jgi:hypothetical protein